MYESFMQPAVAKEKAIFVSDRFKGKDGKPEKVKLKGLSTNEISNIIRENNRAHGDDMTLSQKILAKMMIYPNLKDKELCDYYKLYQPEQVLVAIFNEPSEITKLTEEAYKMLGLKSGAMLMEEGKNF